MMGTTFLQRINDPGKQNRTKTDSEARTYLSSNPYFGGGRIHGAGGSEGCLHTSEHQHGEDQHRLIDGYPIGRPIGGSGLPPPIGGVYPGRPGIPGQIPGGRGDNRGEPDFCRVKIGLRYSSCFSKFEDFDDKFDQIRHQAPNLPRNGDGFGGSSPCGTLQLLAKVKSPPIYDRCQGNQYLMRTPYHLYNIKGELRYIVQDAPHLEQCYLEAACSIPAQLCRSHGYGPSERVSSCEGRQCYHTLLAWDPSAPDRGTFIDVFEYVCCCSCHVVPQPGRAQVVG